MISPVSLPFIISMLSLIVCVIQVSSESLKEIKLIAFVNWFFHSHWVLGLSIKPFK